ncbi:rod shape-determining protein MreD [Spirochaetota bacterium]
MILSYIITGALMLSALVIQGHSSFDVIRIAGVKPDLIFIIVVYLAYSFGSYYGEVAGFMSGLLHDAVSNSPLGFLAFPKMALGFLVGMFGRSVIKSNIVTISLMLFVSSIIKGILGLFLSYIFLEANAGNIVEIILPESFYNALLAPPLFFVLDKIFKNELEGEET